MTASDPLRMCALILAGLVLMLAVFGPNITPYDPLIPDPINRLAPPIATHWFGTDHLGRDVFSRILAGARLSVGLAILVVSAVVEVVGGLVSGMLGRCRAYAPDRCVPCLARACGRSGCCGGSGWRWD
ncbi:hypothetical protein [Thalassococcus sp. S3]|uniref:hypothetical protein n=1 Tax=Thalassococcus sp. S3 TaxID=2017482 RepID=UPI00352CF1F3